MPVVANINKSPLIVLLKSGDQEVNKLDKIKRLEPFEYSVLQDPHGTFHCVVGAMTTKCNIVAIA